MQGKQLYAVPGMAVPKLAGVTTQAEIEALLPQFSSLPKLFVLAARRVQPAFALTPANLDAVASICQRVEGMPLAIELAAAWLEVLTPAEIAAEVARRLDFLASELRDLPERQRSLHAVFESSWRLLGPRRQDAYLRLVVFRGSSARRSAACGRCCAAAAVGPRRATPGLQRGSDGRFQLHELLRQFAEERLRADSTRLDEAHASPCCVLCCPGAAAHTGTAQCTPGGGAGRGCGGI